MVSSVFNAIKGRLLGDAAEIAAAVDFESDTVKLSLHTSTLIPSLDNDVHFDDVDNEVAASGTYAAGGGTLTVASSIDDVDDEGVLDATDISFTSATITARFAIIYKDSGTAATSPLLCWIDFSTDQTSTAGTFTVSFAAEGIVNLG